MEFWSSVCEVSLTFHVVVVLWIPPSGFRLVRSSPCASLVIYVRIANLSVPAGAPVYSAGYRLRFIASVLQLYCLGSLYCVIFHKTLSKTFEFGNVLLIKFRVRQCHKTQPREDIYSSWLWITANPCIIYYEFSASFIHYRV